jgi:hypothetical protein
MKSFLDLIKALYGPKAISSTIGTRTNVIRLPSGELQKYLSKELNIEAASTNAAKNAYLEMYDLIPYVSKMNDSERLIFEGNLRRLKNKLEDSGLIQEENVSSGITAIQSKIDKLKIKRRELEKATGQKATLTNVLNDLGASQKSMSRLNDEGLVRSTAREILINDIKAGKIKNITVSEAINMGEPLDPFRQIYGEGALEQLDSLIPNFRGLKTEMEAEKLARSKFKFEPDENRLPGSVSIEEGRKAEQEFGINKPTKVSDFKAEATKRTSIDDLIDEYNANQDRLRLSDEEGGTAIGYEEFQKIQKRNEDIAKALEEKGISSKVEEAPQAEIIPFRKKPTEPEGKADGGRIGYAYGTPAMGLDYLTGMGPSKGYADGGRIGFKAGSGKKIFDIINKTNQELKIKKPKAGEVTTPTEPVKTVEEPRTLGGLPIDERSANISDEIDKLRASGINSLENEKKLNKLSLEFVDSLDPRRQTKALDYRRKSLDTENKLIIKAEEKGLDFDTYEKLRQGLYGARKQQTLDFIKTGKVNIEPVKPVTTFEEVQNRYRTAAKAADEIFPNYDQPKTAASELANVMAEQKYGKVFDDISGDKQSDLYSEAYDYITSVNRLPKVSPKNVPPQVLEQKMNEVLNTYDKSMFIKNEQGMVDVTNSENIEKMALLLKRDHPELYNRIFNLTDDLNQKEILSDFDVTGRKPNATGGRIGYAEGSDGAPSITLDSHDKAPDNMDKYPIKAGNLELGISGLITGGKNYQSDPYTKLSGSERNISVRGKYNVPNTGVSLLGDIGDVRIKSDRDVNVPQYNYKESIRDILKANPYSVGIEYAPDQNKNINLRYDDQGNVMLRGEYKFAKGGLGYLVGE